MSLAENIDIVIDPSTHTVRAVCLPDLHDKGAWLVEMLRPRIPAYQDFQILNWLRTVIDTQDYHFVRTDHALSLSEVKRERMLAQPIVIDHFVYIEEGADISEGEALYDDLKRWALSLGVAEIIINPKSHVSVASIEARIGKVKKRDQLYVKVGMS